MLYADVGNFGQLLKKKQGKGNEIAVASAFKIITARLILHIDIDVYTYTDCDILIVIVIIVTPSYIRFRGILKRSDTKGTVLSESYIA